MQEGRIKGRPLESKKKKRNSKEDVTAFDCERGRHKINQ